MNMNEWQKLIEDLKAKGKTPEDVRMIVYFYDQIIDMHKILIEYTQGEKNERSNTNNTEH